MISIEPSVKERLNPLVKVRRERIWSLKLQSNGEIAEYEHREIEASALGE